MVEFFEIAYFIFVSDLNVGAAVDFGFNIGDTVWLSLANLLPVVAAVVAVLVVTVVSVAAVPFVIAVVAGVGTIIEVLNRVSRSTI